MKIQCKLNKTDSCMVEIYQGDFLLCVIHSDMIEDREAVERLEDDKTVEATIIWKP